MSKSIKIKSGINFIYNLKIKIGDTEDNTDLIEYKKELIQN